MFIILFSLFAFLYKHYLLLLLIIKCTTFNPSVVIYLCSDCFHNTQISVTNFQCNVLCRFEQKKIRTKTYFLKLDLLTTPLSAAHFLTVSPFPKKD